MKKNKLIDLASAGLLRSKVKISDGSMVSVRAFTVKELKLLMMANTSETAQDTQVVQILSQCIETEGVDVNTLPSHDIEVLYVEIYKLSKGTTMIPVKYRCGNVIDGKKCGSDIATNVNLNHMTLTESSDPVIKLTNGLSVNMRFPNILEMEYFDDEITNVFNLAMRCIDSINTGTEIMKVGVDITEEEVAEVVEYLDQESFANILEFVSNLPTISLKFPLKCPNCGHEEIIELRGLADFFASL